MVTISLKPLSVNKAWQGKRFKTPEYKDYEQLLLMVLPNTLKIPDSPKLKIILRFGVSSKLADWDNPVKPLQDIIQKKYDFNDRRIYKGDVEKFDVKKGEEYLSFKLVKHEQ